MFNRLPTTSSTSSMHVGTHRETRRSSHLIFPTSERSLPLASTRPCTSGQCRPVPGTPHETSCPADPARLWHSDSAHSAHERRCIAVAADATAAGQRVCQKMDFWALSLTSQASRAMPTAGTSTITAHLVLAPMTNHIPEVGSVRSEKRKEVYPAHKGSAFRYRAGCEDACKDGQPRQKAQ